MLGGLRAIGGGTVSGRSNEALGMVPWDGYSVGGMGFLPAKGTPRIVPLGEDPYWKPVEAMEPSWWTGHQVFAVKGGGNPNMSDRRLGVPRTEEERLARHEALYGTSELPPRGTGLQRGTAAQGTRTNNNLVKPLAGAAGGAIVGGLVGGPVGALIGAGVGAWLGKGR